MSETSQDFRNHIILYSKGWYKKSDNPIKDIKQLLSKWCEIEVEYIPDIDIYTFLVDTFNDVTPNNIDKTRWMLEMMGIHWTGKPRAKELVLLGAISCCEGHHCDPDKIIREFAK
ncbi:MAG: hypothetical protein ABFD50_15460 [Smithella sp.]